MCTVWRAGVGAFPTSLTLRKRVVKEALSRQMVYSQYDPITRQSDYA
jgi:hypothetical protein